MVQVPLLVPLLLVPLLLLSAGTAGGQVALRAEPLITGPLGPGARRGGGVGGGGPIVTANKGPPNTTNIESSLAAIFRGVAYGLSPAPTTPPTSTSTTTTPPPPLIIREPANEWAELEEELMRNDIIGKDSTPPSVGVVRAGAGPGAVWVGELGQAWVVHVYCTGGMFTVVGVAGVVGIVRFRNAGSLLPLPHYLSLHLLMIVAAAARCIHLFHDPYGTVGTLPQGVAAVSEEVAWPCLTAALAVVILGVVGAWRRPPHPPAHHAPLTLAAITIFHMALAITTHVLALHHPTHAGPLRAAAQTATAAWGGVVGIGGIVGASRVVRGLARTTVRLTTTPNRSTLLHAARLALVAALVQIGVAALHLYSLLGPPDALHVPPTRPWHWLAVEGARGGLQVVAWLLIALAALRPPSASHNTYRPAHHRPSSHPAKTEARLWRGLWAELWRGRCGSAGRDSAHTRVLPAQNVPRQSPRSHSLTARAHTHPHGPPSIPCFPPPPQRAASEVHLLWSRTRARDAPPSGCSSRPPSLVVSDTALARLAPPSPPPIKKDSKDGSQAYDQHLYYNTDATTPPATPRRNHTMPARNRNSWCGGNSPPSSPSPTISEPAVYDDSDGVDYQLPYKAPPPVPAPLRPRHQTPPPVNLESQLNRPPTPSLSNTSQGSIQLPHPHHQSPRLPHQSPPHHQSPRLPHPSQPDLLPRPNCSLPTHALHQSPRLPHNPPPTQPSHHSLPTTQAPHHHSPPTQGQGRWGGPGRSPQGASRSRICDERPRNCDDRIQICDDRPRNYDERPRICDDQPQICEDRSGVGKPPIQISPMLAKSTKMSSEARPNQRGGGAGGREGAWEECRHPRGRPRNCNHCAHLTQVPPLDPIPPPPPPPLVPVPMLNPNDIPPPIPAPILPPPNHIPPPPPLPPDLPQRPPPKTDGATQTDVGSTPPSLPVHDHPHHPPHPTLYSHDPHTRPTIPTNDPHSCPPKSPHHGPHPHHSIALHDTHLHHNHDHQFNPTITLHDSHFLPTKSPHDPHSHPSLSPHDPHPRPTPSAPPEAALDL